MLPEKIEPVRIERSRARDAADLARGIEVGGREGVSRRKLIFVDALNENIAVEPADHGQCTVEESLLKAELHQHQQHGKADPGCGAKQPLLIGEEVAPGERYRAWLSSGEKARQRMTHGRRHDRQNPLLSKHVGRIGAAQNLHRE